MKSNVKKRLIINRIIAITISIAVAVFGVIFKNEQVRDMGIAMIFVVGVMTVRMCFVFKNKEKMHEYEVSYTDERIAYISNKSYAITLWVSIYAEFLAMIVLMLTGKEDLGMICSYFVCGQLLIYLITHRIMSKKH